MSILEGNESYFDYQDGDKTEKKLWIATKHVGLAALFASTADVLLYSHPKGYAAALGRYGYFCVPLLGMSSAFVLFTDLATNIRNKNDKLNWVIGACAAGVIFGAWRRSGAATFFGSALFSGMALIKKDALQNDYVLLDLPTRLKHGGIRTSRDYTLTAHRPGNWVKE
ncbi:hypothetical protein RN001_001377 [Aquatica leii]|uniref:NADH dehydrogenase [ubiquinone] 1 alpha subcomplex subunit 11 n=1 Tax=Aquatica leii TaxID=1421715 RepID=A0AAN7SCP8_9COLE|nr:hypothetical protein RN001_001377 [Aquatica leii]